MQAANHTQSALATVCTLTKPMSKALRRCKPALLSRQKRSSWILPPSSRLRALHRRFCVVLVGTLVLQGSRAMELKTGVGRPGMAQQVQEAFGLRVLGSVLIDGPLLVRSWLGEQVRPAAERLHTQEGLKVGPNPKPLPTEPWRCPLRSCAM